MYRVLTAHIACSTGGIGNFGWVGGTLRDAIKLGAWNRRVA